MGDIDRYTLERRGVLMEGDPDDPREAWGVLNPASARGRDGEVYLFPRMVAAGNVSRVGRARVRYDDAGDPVGAERLGVVLEPEQDWERNHRTSGVEDPRITFIAALDRYLMTYSGYGPFGARIGLAVSEDLASWDRLGPVSFAYDPGLGGDLNLYSNKDALLLPEAVPGPDGRPAFALLHRPTWDLSIAVPEEDGAAPPPFVSDPRPGIWISYAPAEDVLRDLRLLPRFSQHRQVALPQHPWEELKIGAGTPPIRTPEGWLTIHHGVTGRIIKGTDLQPHVRYRAGLMVLDADDPSHVVARSSSPLLAPELAAEREGIVPNVVFPTAIQPRPDGDHDVFYGMADSRIGTARLHRSD